MWLKTKAVHLGKTANRGNRILKTNKLKKKKKNWFLTEFNIQDSYVGLLCNAWDHVIRCPVILCNNHTEHSYVYCETTYCNYSLWDYQQIRRGRLYNYNRFCDYCDIVITTAAAAAKPSLSSASSLQSLGGIATKCRYLMLYCSSCESRRRVCTLRRWQNPSTFRSPCAAASSGSIVRTVGDAQFRYEN